jgi:hypothetical protein
MKQIVVITILLLHLLLMSCSSDPAGAGSQEDPIFSMEVKNSDDHVSLQYENNSTVIDIESPTGVGSARFRLESGVMPEQILVRLHLKGLEEFRLISTEVSIAASIPSSDGLNAQSQRKISENGEQPIRRLDALWLKVEIRSDSQSIPLQDGYFEIILPQRFIEQSGNSFEIQWIDFFR